MRYARVCGHELWVSDYAAHWDAIAGDSPWEKERIDSILATLNHGDVLYDIGVEHAWMSAIFARQVGGENMVLVEPGPFWATIRKTWERNDLDMPIACWPGFAGAEVDMPDEGAAWVGAWPEGSEGKEQREALPYRHLNHHADQIPTITIDALARFTGRTPRGITCDVEGAEVIVLQGAEETLAVHRPILWISLHPDLIERDFEGTSDDFYHLLWDAGYTTEILRVDHETHVLALPEP
jgi:FkbM family methyltransferase